MTTFHLLLLPGDGIGVETVAEVERVIAFLNKSAKGSRFETESDLVGGAAVFPRKVRQLFTDALALRDRRDEGQLSPHSLAVAVGDRKSVV
jgi:isocitrate/isopropylmalate dehydrogenase